MATKIVGYNIEQTSDPIVDEFRATTHVETPLLRILTSGTDLNLTNRITASNASGNNQSTTALRISSGRSTGSASGGNLIFQITSPGSSGSTVNSFTDVTEISYNSFDIKDLNFTVDGNAFTVNKDTGNTSVLGTLSVGSDVTITGNLTVNGTTTTVNSTTLSVDDKNIELGSITTPTNVTADGGGLTLKGATDKTFNWSNSTSSWTSSEHIDVVSTKNYKIAGTTVLTSDTSSGPSPAAGRVFGRLIAGTNSGDLVTVDDSQTFTNKSLSDSTTYIIDNDSPTKRIQFEISGVTAGQTRTFTAPDLSGTLALIDTAQTFTASHTFRNTSGQKFDQSSGQDGIILNGRAGGSSSYAVTITPGTLTSSKTLTLPDTTGTVVTTGDTGTVTNTMLAGSIANNKLVNSSVTFNNVSVALGSSGTIQSATSIGLRDGSSTAGVPSGLSGSTNVYVTTLRDGVSTVNVTIQ